MIVFGSIFSDGYYNGECVFENYHSCSLGISVGVIAFLGLMGFLVLDALFGNISSVRRRKYVVLADIAFSGTLWAVERIKTYELNVHQIIIIINFYGAYIIRNLSSEAQQNIIIKHNRECNVE